ncbi:hypothetical protein B9Z55_026375 [Caenorhabditis nigoni]|uniref:Peroxisomal ATPase PEX1 N-terminal C-lobe domain-containing protein n=1 Tax=Caenorhabditis nigoni TaxID=1611254 RepID=A0A2G5T3B8_9PELO|nr:hypothetical protein B9Z55_026375 [Caenorhabditis nigoni]
MNQSYPAFVSFHSLSNCFGYAKLLTAINATNDLSLVNEKFNGPTLGSFRMRSCENPNIYCDLQLFGQLPFTNVFVNSVFAEVSGFQERQEVILEKITNKTYCSYIEVAPRTDDDYSVIAQSQASIENEFLNQIRLVSQNMIIPHFLSPGVYVQFRILNIVPATSNPVILTNQTELHVQTVTEGSQSDEKATMAKKVSSIVQDLSTQAFLSNYVIQLEKTPIVGRVLPRKIVESWLKADVDKIDKNTLYISGRENCPYPEKGIVEIRSLGRSEQHESLQFFYLHRTNTTTLKKNDDVLNDSLAHMFDSLQLTNRQHCVDGSGSLESYVNVKIYGVPENRICTLRYCDVMMEKETFQWIEEFEMTNLVTQSIHAEVQAKPILLSVEGTELDVALDGMRSVSNEGSRIELSDKVIRVKVLPSIKGLVKRVTESTCFLLDITTEMIYKKITDPKQKLSESDASKRRRRRADDSETLETPPKTEPTNGTNHMENFGLVQTENFVQIGLVFLSLCLSGARI